MIKIEKVIYFTMNIQVIISPKMYIEILGKSYDINMTELSLSRNQLTTLPESIGELVNLTYLNLYHNQLQVIPESIGKLVNLTYLDLSYNQLTALPEPIGNLINLTNLYLHDNQLTLLPESIGKLVNLRHLYLYGNQLTTLPKSILNIKKSLGITKSAYEIDNLSLDSEFLIFSWLDKELINLPTGLKEIWIVEQKENLNHKLPFGCVIKYYKN
jgi:Leucine-rich repeat (LRR) protein